MEIKTKKLYDTKYSFAFDVKMLFTEEEKLRIIQIYFSNGNNASKAMRQYRITCPGDRVPSRKTIAYVVKNHADRKTLQRKKRVAKVNADEDLAILLYFEGKYCYSNVRRILKINIF